MTQRATGIPSGPKENRPAAGALADGSQYLVTDAGSNNDERQLTEAEDGDWITKDWTEMANVPHGSDDHDDSVPELTDQGVVLSSQIPDLAITETFSVADKTERLALDVQEGDVAIQDDTDETHIFTGGDASDDANWSTMLFPEPPVGSVFGRTGDVTAQSGDYAYSDVDGTHGDADHSLSYVNDGDGVKRRVWVIPNGGSDPADATAEDLIFEKEA